MKRFHGISGLTATLSCRSSSDSTAVSDRFAEPERSRLPCLEPEHPLEALEQVRRLVRVGHHDHDVVGSHRVGPPADESTVILANPERRRRVRRSVRIDEHCVEELVECRRPSALHVLLPAARQDEFEGPQRDGDTYRSVAEFTTDLPRLCGRCVTERFATHDDGARRRSGRHTQLCPRLCGAGRNGVVPPRSSPTCSSPAVLARGSDPGDVTPSLRALPIGGECRLQRSRSGLVGPDVQQERSVGDPWFVGCPDLGCTIGSRTSYLSGPSRVPRPPRRRG